MTDTLEPTEAQRRAATGIVLACLSGANNAASVFVVARLLTEREAKLDTLRARVAELESSERREAQHLADIKALNEENQRYCEQVAIEQVAIEKRHYSILNKIHEQTTADLDAARADNAFLRNLFACIATECETGEPDPLTVSTHVRNAVLNSRADARVAEKERDAALEREAAHLAHIKALLKSLKLAWWSTFPEWQLLRGEARALIRSLAHYDDAKVPCQNTTTDSAGRSTCLLALGHDGLCEWSPRRKHYDNAKADAPVRDFSVRQAEADAVWWRVQRSLDDAKADVPAVSPEMDTLLTKALEAVDARAGQSAEEWAAGIAPFIVADLDTEGGEG